MGGGIAMACANAGLAVTVKDATQAALDAGFATIRRNYDATVKRGRLTPEAAEERLGAHRADALATTAWPRPTSSSRPSSRTSS